MQRRPYGSTNIIVVYLARMDIKTDSSNLSNYRKLWLTTFDTEGKICANFELTGLLRYAN